MKDRQLIQILQETGLTEKEALVYSSSLSLGPSSVLSIAKEAGVRRSTVYSVIESLRQKQLMRKEVRGIKEYYSAEDPERLKMVLENRHEKLLKILPELGALYRLEGAESVIKYYEGVESLKNVYLSMISTVKPGQDYLVLSSIDSAYKFAPDFFPDFLARRAKLNIKVRMILEDTALARHRGGKGRMANERNRILPKGTKLTTNLVIIPQRVFIHQFEAPTMGMVIENQHIITMHREMFELIWASLEE